LLKMISKYKTEFAIHFRYRTRGPKSRSMCHPFRISTGKKYPLYMMHNGTITAIEASEKRSDSAIFAKLASEQLTAIGKGDKPLISDKTFISATEHTVGKTGKVKFPNRILFMGPSGTSILNQDAGFWLDKTDVWYSNYYSFDALHRLKDDGDSL